MTRFSTEPSSCNDILDSILFNEPKKILIYGRAASGKTNFVLNIFKCTVERADKNKAPLSIYISTEGSSYLDRADQLNLLENSSILFAEAIDSIHLASLIASLFRKHLLKHLTILAIDSINYHYRSEAISIDELKRFVALLTLLDTIAVNGVWILATAQVREAIDEVEDHSRTEPSGMQYLEPWADVILRIEAHHNQRKLIIEKPTRNELPFRIMHKGIEWL